MSNGNGFVTYKSFLGIVGAGLVAFLVAGLTTATSYGQIREKTETTEKNLKEHEHPELMVQVGKVQTEVKNLKDDVKDANKKLDILLRR